MTTTLYDARPVYSEVMEDYLPISKALSLQKNDILVSVASAGDNVFSSVLENIRHVFGVDINPLQIDFCRLKEEAIRYLSWEEFMGLMGVFKISQAQRVELLRAVTLMSSLGSYLTLDSLNALCINGLAFCSHLDLLLAPLRQELTGIIGEGTIVSILTERDQVIRQNIWNQHFENSQIFKTLQKYLNEENISGAFIPRWAFPLMKERPFHSFFYSVIKRQLVEFDPTHNYFMHHLLLGRFIDIYALPPYLKRGNYNNLQNRLSSITWHLGGMLEFLKTLPNSSVNAINLSNIFDWCDECHFKALWEQINYVAVPGTRVLLRSFLGNRPIPCQIADLWHQDTEKAAYMELDRVGYYSRYELWVRV